MKGIRNLDKDIDIELNHRYGCLTVLDMGEEYFLSEQYQYYKDKFNELKNKLRPYINELKNLKAEDPLLYEMETNNASGDLGFHVKYRSIIEKLNLEGHNFQEYNRRIKTHYKCLCKCGKFHYYDEKTLKSKPKYCFYPVPISERFTYSISAQNATYRKRKKYDGLENVTLRNKTECLPSDEFCECYNKYKTKQLIKNEEKFRREIASIPRDKADNYDVNYVGMKYESFEVVECTNDALESEPIPYFTQQHHKCYRNITVYKQYRCRCYLCGRERLITCDKFGIYPPTKYGLNAYYGYWSKVQCGCHTISSFQWIVNKLLIENAITYSVEVSFPDLYGVSGDKHLRFDFAIYNEDGFISCLIECQGEQHYKPIEEFGGEYQFKIQKQNDQIKRAYAKKQNIPLLEISYKDKQYEKVKKILIQNEILNG